MTTVHEITCADVVELLTDHLEESLPSGRAADVESHLATCADCAGYLTEMREALRLLAALPPEPPPEQTRRRLQALFRDWAAHR